MVRVKRETTRAVAIAVGAFTTVTCMPTDPIWPWYTDPSSAMLGRRRRETTESVSGRPRQLWNLWKVWCALLTGMVALGASGCSIGSDTGPVLVAGLVISPSAASVVAGTTLQFTAAPRDVNGKVLTDRAVHWSVSSTGTASIDDLGLLTAIAPGSVTVVAKSEGQSISAEVSVLPVPVASVAVSPTTASVVAGATQQLLATPLDAAGNPLTARLLTWTSSAPSLATVDAVGLLTALAPGVVQISASSEGHTGSATITVTPGGAGPIVTAITPATLQPGTTVTITGVGLSNTNTGNVVTIGGVVAPIVTATNTQLTVGVPCVESGNAAVRVTTNGIAGPSLTRLVQVTRQSLAVGQAVIVTSNAASSCTELAATSASARYIVTVFSASTSANAQTDFELTGNTPPAGTSAVQVAMPQPLRARANTMADVQASQNAAADAAHFAFLERDRAQYELLRERASVMRARSPLDTRASARALAALPAIGDMRNSYYTLSTTCADTTRVIRGKAIYVGTRAIIWEDTANAVQSSASPVVASYYQRLGQIFDLEQYESVKSNFGDPLLRDAVTDNDGRVHMIFSQRLNGSGVAAYVTSCDQYPTSISAGSNFGQFFYGAVPSTTTLNMNSTNSPDGWFYFTARTVVHELKHIAAMSARVANNAPSFEQSWLEEGTARHAEELWVRESLHHVAWKGNAGFGTASTDGVYCDFNPLDATCNAADALRRPGYGMRRHFDEIRDKLLAPWDYSPYGDAVVQSTSTFYQTAWSLVRYAIDRYASSDASFFHTLINSQTTGTVNLAATAGVSMDQLIGGWGLALYADDYPGLTSPSPDIQFPTWNLRSIYAGLNALPAWSSRWNTPFPIQPAQLSFGSFVSRVAGLRGGAQAYFEISGATAGTQLVGIRSTQGTVVPSNLRIAIARLQ